MDQFRVSGTLRYWRDGRSHEHRVATEVPARDAQAAAAEVLSNTCGYLYAERAEWITPLDVRNTTEGMDRMSFDGSCDPNPGGKMGWSYIITFADGRVEQQHQHTPPARANTVNIAEYCGLRDGLQAYIAAGGKGPLRVTGDSQLVVNQVNGVYKVRKPELKPYYDAVKNLMQQIGAVTLAWNPREQNVAADRLARGNPSSPDAPVDDDLFLSNDLQKTLSEAVVRAIAQLNANPSPGFKDYASLRTGGLDAFSQMSLAAATKQAGPVATSQISAALTDSKAQATALRWALRGLGVKRAIRKAEVDAEIASKSRR